MSKPLSKFHEIIGRFVSKEASKGNKYFWPKEMKISKQILQKYPYEFLMQLKEPFNPIKMNSLAWFLSEDGKEYLSSHLIQYSRNNEDLTEQKQEIILVESKIGEDKVIPNKPKSLKDFLNLK